MQFLEIGKWIFLIMLSLVGLMVLFKKDVPNIIKLIMLASLIFLYISFFRHSDTFIQSKNQKLAELNLIDYLGQLDQEGERYSKLPFSKSPTTDLPGLVPFYAFTKRAVNLRERPDATSQVIRILGKDTKVGLIMPLEKQGTWIQVNAEQKIGWVSGIHLRPEIPSDKDRIIKEIWITAFRYGFPEPTLIQKIIGWGMGIPVSLIIGLLLRKLLGWHFSLRLPMMGRFTINELELGVPLLYYLVKNKYFVPSLFEFLPFFFFSFIAALPANLLILLIQKNRQRY